MSDEECKLKRLGGKVREEDHAAAKMIAAQLRITIPELLVLGVQLVINDYRRKKREQNN